MSSYYKVSTTEIYIVQFCSPKISEYKVCISEICPFKVCVV